MVSGVFIVFYLGPTLKKKEEEGEEEEGETLNS